MKSSHFRFRFLLILAVSIAVLGFSGSLSAADHIIVTTWNIETLGGEGRGFAGGFGRGDLDPRTPAQLKQIAELIKDELKSDILAVQEVSITRTENGTSFSAALDTIVAELGSGWKYYLPEVDDIPDGHGNLFCALVWNENRVRALDVFTMNPPNPYLGGADLFDRKPVVGYFEALKNGQGVNDFVIINVHLKSGQHYDENHMIAMVELEHGLYRRLKNNQVKETDRIILGDFNDNPYAKTESNKPKYSNAMYVHMEFKKYRDLVTPDFHSTRMDTNLTSVIDHILVNSSAKLDIPTDKASIYLPGASSTFAEWRKTYSDHFPISFKIKIKNSDTDVDF